MIVSLQFDNSLIGVVIDRFGNDVIIVKMDEHHFRITVPVVMSPTFLAWMFQFDDKIRFTGPATGSRSHAGNACKNIA